MGRMARGTLVFAILALLVACAGRNFVRPAADAFKLGQTNYAQVIQQMGQAGRSGEVLKNGKTVKVITYAFATTGGEPLEAGVTPARALSYFFHDGVLVGQEFVSSFRADHSNFDESKMASIVKGRSTRAEVLALLGPPSAGFLPPMVKETSGEALGYGYSTTRGGVFGGFKFFHKLLRVSFDDHGVVSDVEFVSTGSR